MEAELRVVWRANDFIRPFMESKGLMGLATKPKAEVVALAAETGASVPPEILTPAFDAPRFARGIIAPSRSVEYRGKVFLFVDDKLYSSFESFAAFCRGTGWATMLGLNPDWSANEEMHTCPDVPVEMTVEDLGKYMDSNKVLIRPDATWDAVLRECI